MVIRLSFDDGAALPYTGIYMFPFCIHKFYFVFLYTFIQIKSYILKKHLVYNKLQEIVTFTFHLLLHI